MGAAHALLSASSAAKWFVCPPSARLEETMEDRGSKEAREGTLAHKLAELTLRFRLLGLAKKTYTAELKKIQADELYQPEMLEHVENFAAYVADQFQKLKASGLDPVIELEKRLDYSMYAPEGFGTGDVVIASEGLLVIIDFKYGTGVMVNAEENLQLKLYALGGLSEYGLLYDLPYVMTAIFQPRIDNIAEYHYDVNTDLLPWAEGELKPRALLAYNGEGEYCPGEHCSKSFCKAANQCRARAVKNLEMAKYDFADPPLLSEEEISEILLTVKELEKWAKDVWNYAETEALNGKAWPNFKLVEGRSNRAYADPDEAVKVLCKAGFEADKIAPRKLLGITDMEKAITKKTFKEILTDGGYVVKPEGKPTLVPMADQRPALGSAEGAA